MPIVGENQPVVPGTFTQSTVPGNAGVSAPSDNFAPLKSAQNIAAGGAFDNVVYPLPNLLGRYSSYTYAITWYLMTADAMAALQKGDQSILTSQIIIAQSGGVNNDQRNPYFDVDFYFDNLEMKTNLAGAGNNAPSSAHHINFTVVEPNGISLLPRLQAAINGTMGNSGGQQLYASQIYLMVVRFYGYDEQGNMAQVGVPLQDNAGTALIQKFIPFQITNFNFKVENKLVEYNFEGTISGNFVATAQNQNSLMYNVELSGMSVQEVLTTGAATNGNQQAPQNGATPKNTVRQGLTSALNQYQLDLVKSGAVTYPNTYVIEFADDSIANAKVTVKDGKVKGTGMPVAGSAADKLDPNRQSMDTTVRLMDFTAGQQVTQIIEQVVRNSTYITDQSNLRVAESTQLATPKPEQGLTWFKISFEATPGQYDPKRNDYAYTIRYVVSKYRTLHMISPYFQPSAYPGVHKTYEYWFTGLNTEVLKYEQTYTPQTTITISNKADTGSTSSNNEYKQAPSPRSGQTAQGASGRTNDIAANAAEFLYSTDLNKAEITILGDPAWIPQNEVVGLPAIGQWSNKAFMADGTINFEQGDTLFEIAINAPADYDLSTGLMDPDTQINGIIDNEGKQNQARRRYIYSATEITSTFRDGEFTQVLIGNLRDDLTKQRYDEINSNISKETRQGIFDKTPLRTSKSIVGATDYGIINGQALPRAMPYNPNPQKPNTAINQLNALPNLPARPSQSNGDIQNLPASPTNLVTNSTTQIMNRET